MNPRVIEQVLFVLTVIAVVSVNFSVAVSSIAMGVGIACLCFRVVITRGANLPRTSLEFLFLAYCLAELLSTLFSVSPADSFINMKRLFLLLITYMVVVSLDSEDRLKALLACLMIVAGVLTLFEAFSLTTIGGEFARVSLFQYFLTEGGIKMIVLLILIPLLLHTDTPRGWKIMALLSALPLLVGLVLTQTRSSWIAFIGGVVTIGLFRNKKIILGLVLLIIIFLLVAPANFRARATSIFDPTMTSNLTRIHMVTTGWQMFWDRPLFGWGDIDLKKYYVTYITPIDEAEGGHLHNNLVMLLVTLGIIGFGVVLALFIRILILEIDAVRTTSRHWLFGSVSLGSLAAYVGFHINGLFEWNFGDHEIAVLLWFSVGAAIVSQKLYLQDEAQ